MGTKWGSHITCILVQILLFNKDSQYEKSSLVLSFVVKPLVETIFFTLILFISPWETPYSISHLVYLPLCSLTLFLHAPTIWTRVYMLFSTLVYFTPFVIMASVSQQEYLCVLSDMECMKTKFMSSKQENQRLLKIYSKSILKRGNSMKNQYNL